ncbi:hypothetical protein A6V36_12780 [Paraburkholderia ginsengiterrae]|uniref:Uncharacterized protein n=1 Tax=Paraburkholderia ginsengiterrae TaxID=1462993 RepID=A0ABX2ULK9_9BURK|nr:hypothetical protein A6V36_12780 [Paraburkholderia ginsengiterrae]
MVGRMAECEIQIRADDIHQQGVQREYHLYDCADSLLYPTAHAFRPCLIEAESHGRKLGPD